MDGRRRELDLALDKSLSVVNLLLQKCFVLDVWVLDIEEIYST